MNVESKIAEMAQRATDLARAHARFPDLTFDEYDNPVSAHVTPFGFDTVGSRHCGIGVSNDEEIGVLVGSLVVFSSLTEKERLELRRATRALSSFDTIARLMSREETRLALFAARSEETWRSYSKDLETAPAQVAYLRRLRDTIRSQPAITEAEISSVIHTAIKPSDAAKVIGKPTEQESVILEENRIAIKCQRTEIDRLERENAELRTACLRLHREALSDAKP